MKKRFLESKKNEIISGLLAIGFVLATGISGYFVLKSTVNDNSKINDYLKQTFVGKNGSALAAGLDFFMVKELEDGQKLGHIWLDAERQNDFNNPCMIHLLFDKNLFIKEAYVTGSCQGIMTQ